MFRWRDYKVVKCWIKYYKAEVPDIKFTVSFNSLDDAENWLRSHPQYRLYKYMFEYEYVPYEGD